MTIKEKNNDSKKTTHKETENKTEDRIYPEEKIEDGTNPDHRVKDSVNEDPNDLIEEEKKIDSEEREEPMYPDEAGTPVI